MTRKCRTVLIAALCAAVLMYGPVEHTFGLEAEYPTIEEYRSGGRSVISGDAEGSEATDGDIGDDVKGTGEAEGADYTVIRVGTESELRKVADEAQLDAWSGDKRIELTADIALTEPDLMIPVFAGIFDGAGHTISGLRFDRILTDGGLFRFVQQGGIVKNLNVAVHLRPTGSAECIGGIAAHNYGTIQNCTVYGSVWGKADIGGIAGVNELGGIINQCENGAQVVGDRRAGGVAGQNLGEIARCTNNGEINTVEPDTGDGTTSLEELSELADSVSQQALESQQGGENHRTLESKQNEENQRTLENQHDGETQRTYDDLQTRENATPAGLDGTDSGDTGASNAYTGGSVDSGGIAGRSSGIINHCKNYGTVGYIHSGYCTGGIVGTQDAGWTLGSENKGSVCGRRNVGGIAGQLRPLLELEYLQTNLNRLDDEIESCINSLQKLTSDLSGTLGDSVDTMSNITESLKSAQQQVADVTAQGGDLLTVYNAQLGSISDAMAVMGSSLDTAGQHTDSALATDKRQIDATVSNVNAGIDTVNSDVSKVVADINLVIDDINRAAAGIEEAKPEVEQHLSELREEIEQLQESGTVLQETIDRINKIVDELQGTYDALKQGIDDYEYTAIPKLSTGQLGHISMDMVLPSVSEYTSALEAFTHSADGSVAQMTDATAVQQAQMKNTLQQLDRTVSGIADEATRLSELLGAGNDAARADFDAIADSARSINDTIAGVRDDLFNYDGFINYEDVSESYVERSDSDILKGRIEGCTNERSVSADVNAGGIAGQVSVDSGVDGDSKIEGETSLSMEARQSAVIVNCTNRASVAAKKNHAGGIAGRMACGVVAGSYAYCDVTGPSYTGGIVGEGAATVQQSCYSGSIGGDSNLGGIAGLGRDIFYCCAMPDYTGDEPENVGGIAGSIAEGGRIYGNIYVGDHVGGIGGIDYNLGAAPIAYEDLQSISGLPFEFRTIHITFAADGRTVASMGLGYGEAIPADRIPAVPEKPGYYGRWPADFDYGCVRAGKVLEAEYSKYVTSLATDGGDILVGGDFYPEQELVYADGRLSITDAQPGTYAVRVRTDIEEPVVRTYVRTADEPVVTAYRRSGSYIAFDMEIPGGFTIEEAQRDRPAWAVPLIIAVTAAAVVISLIIIIIHTRHLKRRKTQSQVEEDSQDGTCDI